MYYNTFEFWQAMENLPDGHPDRPSPRACRLLNEIFYRWESKSPAIKEEHLGHLFDHLSKSEAKKAATEPVMVRKAMAVAKMLEILTSDQVGAISGSYRVSPDDLLLGTMPPYSVGQGKELLRYLTEAEALDGAIGYLNEWSPFGHVVPDHEVVLQKGINGLIAECREHIKSLDENTTELKGADKDARITFYRSVEIALQGVIHFANRYADLAEKTAESLDPKMARPLKAAAKRLRHVPANPPRNLTEAAQCIFIVHCALHYTGEIVPLGRLDQLLIPFYKADKIKGTEAQEIIDCLWIKLGDRAILHNEHAEDRFTCADGALLGMGGASNFDQGALLNQWMQQITIGGVIADNAPKPKDATNPITYHCLEAARRLPVNSPTLDLRLHKNSPKKLLKFAAKTLLSGGAHPVLLNDERIIRGLKDLSGGKVELASARNYACDGCFETLFAGETDFTFSIMSATEMLEKALNRGATLGAAGAMHLQGMKDSWRTEPLSKITSFGQLMEIMRKHLLLKCHRYVSGIFRDYGRKESVSPSPLLSAVMGGCLQTGRDLSAGGSRYHMVSPLLTSISTCADSLYVIRELVFEEKLFTLEELVACLKSNWGDVPPESSAPGMKLSLERIHEIRALAMAQPKFGQGNRKVDELAWQLIDDFNEIFNEAKNHPTHAPALQMVHDKYDHEVRDFEFIFAPGVGTFEQYVFSGSFLGASPDGRKAGQPIASDMSPAPQHLDEEPATRINDLMSGLNSYNHKSIDQLSDGAPADFNIREDFPESELVKAIERFADGKAGNILTFTVANPETFANASENPDAYNLVRVRMGGWSEFFIALFPDHQNQHRRRPLYT